MTASAARRRALCVQASVLLLGASERCCRIGRQQRSDAGEAVFRAARNGLRTVYMLLFQIWNACINMQQTRILWHSGAQHKPGSMLQADWPAQILQVTIANAYLQGGFKLQCRLQWYIYLFYNDITNQADTKTGCSRTSAKVVTKYGIGADLLDMLTLAILHSKRQCNATNNEVRIPSYMQKLHHNHPDFWRRPTRIQRYALTAPRRSMWFKRAEKSIEGSQDPQICEATV